MLLNLIDLGGASLEEVYAALIYRRYGSARGDYYLWRLNWHPSGVESMGAIFSLSQQPTPFREAHQAHEDQFVADQQRVLNYFTFHFAQTSGGQWFNSIGRVPAGAGSIGNPFDPNGSRVQIGVDPRTLTPGKDLSTLDPRRQQSAVRHGGDHTIIVDRTGKVLDGNHRLNDALQNNRPVDIQIGY
ncbi:MAG: hypothetical protein FWD03_06565 [Defluviitaleaceae bacterium]|nr:hypothetical protein [Defluviitaleaceae bacterium]